MYVFRYNTSVTFVKISHVLKNGDILVSEDSDVVRLISGDRIQIVVRSATV